MQCAHDLHERRGKSKDGFYDNQLKSARINASRDHEYSNEMVSDSALTNQIFYFEKSILKCVDSVIGKSNLKLEICYIALR